MGSPLLSEEILFRQRMLSCCGLYTDTLDGRWGKNTDDADKAFSVECNKLASAHGAFDARSERNIRTLRLDAQKLCRQSLAKMLEAGLDARVISGTRTYEEQAALYRKGRFGNKERKVTNAQAGKSWHNFGLAWDIGIFRGGDYLEDGPEYDRAHAVGMVPGIEWGGSWRTFVDRPHYQAPFGATSIAGARGIFEAGGR